MKRTFDIIASLVAIFLLFPVMIFIAIAIFKKVGAPVLFYQIRPSKDGKPFTILKFRTMDEGYDSNGNLKPDKDRITTFGALLRNTSLDELPELWNVLIGDMSLVGPRPLLMEYLPLYTKEQYRRHDIKPGITGWAQINGRNAISWEEKFSLDIWYVDNRSFLLDIKILFITIKKVISREGINAEGCLTMPFYKGSEKQER
ncbi:MAG: sugar transferase [Candidatus Endonucleobacter bathymodioli]|uniref:Sugar transferase n=1 Tax=Candidatus Endonucleibacter bathymodioli TaxID=539814 RepID=A0AA90NVR9_9GAMM|nr:sugar transferase [Candidatus Endonucleobacter bathymodioli]